MKPKTSEYWYFAHPFTGKGPQKIAIERANYELCLRRTIELTEVGIIVFSPIVNSFPIHYGSPLLLGLPGHDQHEFYMDMDFAIIQHTNFTGVILPPLWEHSDGCRREEKKFRSMGRRIALYAEALANACNGIPLDARPILE